MTTNSPASKKSEKRTLTTSSAGETVELGRRIGSVLRPRDVLVLNGPLGAGKTTLTQGIACGLEVKDYVTSPSFIIINEYQGRIPFYHIDLYRLDQFSGVEELGIEEYFSKEGACVVEWGEKLDKLLPADAMEVELKIISENKRSISLPQQIVSRPSF